MLPKIPAQNPPRVRRSSHVSQLNNIQLPPTLISMRRGTRNCSVTVCRFRDSSRTAWCRLFIFQTMTYTYTPFLSVSVSFLRL
ncbi:hypothetical protein CPC08DRAFT_314833 [Agrocybe pediades]|nr:hypothetical protein CPC08DRAFT_314833 [Agrocybe pediades]